MPRATRPPDPEPTRCATLTGSQVAAKLGVSPGTVRRNAACGVLPFRPVRVGRRVVYSASAVNRMLGLPADAEPQAGGGA